VFLVVWGVFLLFWGRLGRQLTPDPFLATFVDTLPRMMLDACPTPPAPRWQVHAWLDGMAALDYVAKTLPGRERYIKHVAKYAHGAARSKVGNAVKRGVSAHDYDDDVDDR